MEIIAAGRTHIGRRKNNEDSHRVEAELGLYVVADGMGGYEGGEIASRLVVDVLGAFFRRNADDEDVTWPCSLDPMLGFVANELSTGVVLAQRAVIAQQREKLNQMGSTVVALAIDGDRATFAHLGDSRAYRLREDELRQITRDHSYAEMVRAAGGDLAPAGFGHVVTRAIGRDNEGPPELTQTRLRSGDRLLLCSDGLTDILSDIEIAMLLGSHTDPDVVATCLVEEAYLAGGTDNITVVVICVR